MREIRLGIIASIAVHSCVIPLLIAASMCLNNRPGKLVEVDFTLVKNQLTQLPAAELNKQTITKTGQAREDGITPRRMEDPHRPIRDNPAALPRRAQVSPPPEPTPVTAFDPQGETITHGAVATSPESFDSASSLQADGRDVGGSGYGQGASVGGANTGQSGSQGSGTGLITGGGDYNYIREAVMKNIKYPDEALRLGIEGRVLISFIVLEDGTTSKIRVVSGSGYQVLDESAKEAVATTRIRKKVPYRVVVHLPVKFKIQG